MFWEKVHREICENEKVSIAMGSARKFHTMWNYFGIGEELKFVFQRKWKLLIFFKYWYLSNDPITTFSRKRIIIESTLKQESESISFKNLKHFVLV